MPGAKRLPIVVRPARSDDIRVISTFDHSYSTDYVWQVDVREEQGQINTTFRQARLPRSVRVLYPRDAETLAAVWTQRRLFIVAEVENQVRGYLSVMEAPMNDTGWVAEFAVERKVRRQGIGAALISSTVDWARNVGLRRLLIEVQSKNYPAISFCQKHGFAFCGYNDLYFANQDIALFFGTLL
ncbi:MAG TPA: GNAT family N-acetyltransferase [Anaerolineales bacterium]|nr:GNAT family N-acetyltransferase [Anaerolineales bacterium]